MLTNVGVGLFALRSFRSTRSARRKVFDSGDLLDKEQVCGLLSPEFRPKSGRQLVGEIAPPFRSHGEELRTCFASLETGQRSAKVGHSILAPPFQVLAAW